MMEKYNVVDTTLSGGGGEYPNQDGFGWTNGVWLGMMYDKSLPIESNIGQRAEVREN
jgi:alpha,alpha-trehalase